MTRLSVPRTGDDMEPRLKSQYLKILRDLNADENPMLSTWLDGEATGEHKGYLAGLEKGRKRGRAEGIREGMEKGKLGKHGRAS